MIADLAGDRTTFAPGTAEFIDNDPTLAGIGVFSDPISGYLLITPVNGTADGSFSLADNYGLPSNNSITRDNALDGSLGKSLKYTLTAATADNIKTVINNLKYTATSAPSANLCATGSGPWNWLIAPAIYTMLFLASGFRVVIIFK